MRLTQQQRGLIRKNVADFDPAARVMLFGSRLDDQRRGGDIDLLIRSRKIDFTKRLRLKLALMDALGAQKIDIAVDDGSPLGFRQTRPETSPRHMKHKEHLQALAETLRQLDSGARWLRRSYNRCHKVYANRNWTPADLDAFEALTSRYSPLSYPFIFALLYVNDFGHEYTRTLSVRS